MSHECKECNHMYPSEDMDDTSTCINCAGEEEREEDILAPIRKIGEAHNSIAKSLKGIAEALSDLGVDEIANNTTPHNNKPNTVSNQMRRLQRKEMEHLKGREDLVECPTCGKVKESEPSPDGGTEVCPDCGEMEMMDYEGEVEEAIDLAGDEERLKEMEDEK